MLGRKPPSLNCDYASYKSHYPPYAEGGAKVHFKTMLQDKIIPYVFRYGEPGADAGLRYSNFPHYYRAPISTSQMRELLLALLVFGTSSCWCVGRLKAKESKAM